MRKLPALTIAVLLQISVSVGMSNADEMILRSQGQTSAPKEEIVVPAYLDVAFDRKIDKVPVPFLGHNIKQVYEAFDERTRSEQRNDRETTKQYKKRLAGLQRKPLFGSVGIQSVLAFVASPKLKYDADNQVLTIILITTRLRSDKSLLAMDVKTASWKNETSSQNAAAEIAETEESYYESFELAIHNASRLNTERSSDDNEQALIVQRTNMSIEEAKRSKLRIAALILAKPIAPYHSYEARRIPGTFDDESEYYYEHFYIHADLIEIWIYNKLTGKIMAKMKVK